MKKDVVAGLGEIGTPILKLLSKNFEVVGYDLNTKLMNQKKFDRLNHAKTSFLHIAIPVSPKFDNHVLKLNEKFNPECIVIHSTISPGTTDRLQKKINIPIIYSATRGVHKRMIKDIQRYSKFFAVSPNAPQKKWATETFSKKMKKSGINTKKMSKPETLELAKIICDTSYLGWLINYSQISNQIAKSYGVDYDEMWSFSDEIHKILGNRPKMFPGYIGGHCVIPNLELMNNETLNLIKQLNDMYLKKNPKAKSIKKK
jgi:UDP-N-acetyl-D-mannosaminuronate dehydrogenase